MNYPLDPLSADEFTAVAAIIRREHGVGDGAGGPATSDLGWRIASIELVEPTKTELAEFESGGTTPPRRAEVVCLQRTNNAIRRAVPGARIKYMRAPGGNFTPAFVKVAADLKMKSIYWQVDPRDWEHPKGETSTAHRAKVVRTVKKHVGKGAIVLSHDYRQPETIAAYTSLLPWLKKRYRLIALP